MRVSSVDLSGVESSMHRLQVTHVNHSVESVHSINWLRALVIRASGCVALGSTPGCAIPRTVTMVPVPPFGSFSQYRATGLLSRKPLL